MYICIADLNTIRNNVNQIDLLKSKLSSVDWDKYKSFKGEVRGLQFLLGRAMIFDATGQHPQVADDGRLLLQGQKISLAHSGRFVVLAISDSDVGIDIEDTTVQRDFTEYSKLLGFGKCASLTDFYRRFVQMEALYKANINKGIVRYWYLGDFIVATATVTAEEAVIWKPYHMQELPLIFVGGTEEIK